MRATRCRLCFVVPSLFERSSVSSSYRHLCFLRSKRLLQRQRLRLPLNHPHLPPAILAGEDGSPASPSNLATPSLGVFRTTRTDRSFRRCSAASSSQAK